MKNILITLFVLFMLSCTFTQEIRKIPNLYSYNDDFILGDSFNNPLNEDNRIFKSNREFVYNYYFYKDSLRKDKHKFFIEPYWRIREKDTSMQYHSSINPIFSDNYLVDKLRIKVVNRKTIIGIENKQTVVKYEYFNDKGTIKSLSEVTGIIEDSSYVFIHLPRSACFSFLQYAAFPRVKFTNPKQKWSGTVHIRENSTLEMPSMSLDYFFMDLGQETIDYNNQKLECRLFSL
jgi:hypothetical protein